MKTEIIASDHPDTVATALRILQNGGLAAFPTDTVYGVGSLAFDQKAIEAVYIAKDRPMEKAIPVLLWDLEDLPKVTSELPPLAVKLAARFWPGPVTLVVLKNPNLPPAISATQTVAVRVPDHEVARAILKTAGPMAVTSANISGRQSPVSAQEVYAQLNGRIPLIVDGGVTPGGVPSTVVDCTAGTPVILREGPVGMTELLSAL